MKCISAIKEFEYERDLRSNEHFYSSSENKAWITTTATKNFRLVWYNYLIPTEPTSQLKASHWSGFKSFHLSCWKKETRSSKWTVNWNIWNFSKYVPIASPLCRICSVVIHFDESYLSATFFLMSRASFCFVLLSFFFLARAWRTNWRKYLENILSYLFWSLLSILSKSASVWDFLLASPGIIFAKTTFFVNFCAPNMGHIVSRDNLFSRT